MAKRKIIEAKVESSDEESFFERHKKKIGFLITFVIGSMFFFSLWKMATVSFVEKNTTNNYICQIVGTDVDSGILAMKCMIK